MADEAEGPVSAAAMAAALDNGNDTVLSPEEQQQFTMMARELRGTHRVLSALAAGRPIDFDDYALMPDESIDRIRAVAKRLAPIAGENNPIAQRLRALWPENAGGITDAANEIDRLTMRDRETTQALVDVNAYMRGEQVEPGLEQRVLRLIGLADPDAYPEKVKNDG